MDISTNGDAMDNVQETRISLHHKDIIIVPENEKSVVKQKHVNFGWRQKLSTYALICVIRQFCSSAVGVSQIRRW